MEEGIEKFSEIFAGPTNNYASFLEKLTLKKSSNNELFEHIKNNWRIKWLRFLINEHWKNFKKDGHPIPHKTLDT